MADTEVANLVKDAVLTNEVNQRVSREAGAGDAGRSGNLSKESSQETSQRESVSENGKKKTKEEKPPAKVVIRRLPPSMTKEIFLKEISPVPEHDYFYFVPGDPFAGTQMGFSRAYINFIHQEDIFRFTETYDNYVFVDSKGQEYPAIVEFALFQRIPKQRTKKRDTFSGSIQSDSTYLAFKETLEAAAVAKPDVTSKQHFFETDVSSNATQEATTTPLLEFLKQKRVDKARIRDERREEKKRKEAERKLRLKGKKSEAEEEPKDIKLLQPKEKKECGVKDPRNGRRSDKENRAKENRSREFKSRNNKNHPDEKVKIEKRKEKEESGADKKEVAEKVVKEDLKGKSKSLDDSRGELGDEGGRSGGAEKKRNNNRETKSGEGHKKMAESSSNKNKEKKITEGEDKSGEEANRKGRNERNKSVRKERERRRRESYFAKKVLEKKTNSDANVDERKKTRTFRNSVSGDAPQPSKDSKTEDSQKPEAEPDNDKYEASRVHDELPSGSNEQNIDISYSHKRRGSLDGSDSKEPRSQSNNSAPKRRSSLESARMEEESRRSKSPLSEEHWKRQESTSREMSYDEKRDAESDDGGDKSSRLNQEDKASKSDQDDKEKDPRTGRRIRNKDRPSIQIYRPGMGKLSKHRLEKEKTLGSSTEVDSPSHSPSPVPKSKPSPPS